MSDTPETDALEQKQSSKGCPQWNDMMRWVKEHAALARKLERERNEARAVAYDLAVIASHCLGSHGSALLTETSERIAYTLKRWRELKQ